MKVAGQPFQFPSATADLTVPADSAAGLDYEAGPCTATFAGSQQIVGVSTVMQKLFRDVRKVAAADAPVFISGESGTGKELTARAIHERSPRARGPFVAVDCGALPRTIIQSELFGYERGAFTGATQRRIGRIEAAEGGTVFLDEIGDLPMDLQSNLLRFLQESTICRVGSNRQVRVAARVIAATHVDLEKAVKEGRFRQDLYFRLNVLEIRIPALRERLEDLEVLARFFFNGSVREFNKPVKGFSRQAVLAMRAHSWPGNVRELSNRICRAIVMCDGEWITPRDLELNEQSASSALGQFNLDPARAMGQKETIEVALNSCGDNLAQAARALGVSRTTLYRLLKNYRLQVDRNR
jgi:DNA-binding NtrC family response regulator